MPTYNKRVGFLISDQHLIAHGGIGQFAKSFVEMSGRLNWKTDIILDKAATGDFSRHIKEIGANLISPKEPLRYNEHTATFMYNDSINFEKIVNFRKALVQAFETNLYDMIVCNTQEAMSAAYALAVDKYIPVVFYTHSHTNVFKEKHHFSDVSLDNYHSFFNKHMEFANITAGTQSPRNKATLEAAGAVSCEVLPMPLSERGLLEPNNCKNQNGVLFIGRWEDRKNPKAFLRVISETKLPARVMTNSNGAKKFEKAFADAGITNYVIKAGIVGQEKVDFIKESKLFFMPSLGENYPFAFSECVGHLPCVVLDKQNWSDNFDPKYYRKVNIEDASNTVKELYDTGPVEGALDYVKELDGQVSVIWSAFLNKFVGKKSTNNSANINSFDTVKYRDYISSLNRTNIAREDFESVLTNKHKYRVIYTDEDTYLTKDPNWEPVEEATGTDLFGNF